MAERIAEEAEHGVDLLAKAAELLRHAEGLLTETRAAKDARNALLAVRECSRVVELMAKLRGEIDTSTTVNVIAAPILIELQTVILHALERHPDARQAVLAALAGISGPPLIEARPEG